MENYNEEPILGVHLGNKTIVLQFSEIHAQK
jgi:hypothetical protein